MKSLVIIGRRWFQKTAGNTYHTASITINGNFKCHTDRTYGYGDQYLQTAEAWLEEKGYIKLERYQNGMSEGIRQYCDRNDISLHYECSDVARQKDL